ncbi:MAG: PQQ-binding-like beta-propeller repeat protein, partial [Opitutaceae bacterium]
MKTSLRGASVVFLLGALLPAEAAAQEWTRFRGPNGTGISTSKGIPTSWTEQDFHWRVEVPGQSHAQPVIWGDKLFVTTAIDAEKERALLCYNKNDGKERWRKSYPMPPHRPGNRNASSANGSPVVDGGRVIATFVSRENFWVRSFDHEGNEQWSRDLGTFRSQHGHGASPMIYENMVIVTNDQDGESFVIALDLKTGNPVWKSARRSSPQSTAYGTPCVNPRPGSTPELLFSSQSHGISSLDPKTGALNWEAPVYRIRVVASPVVAGDVVIGSCGQGGGAGNYMAAVKLGGTGDVSKTHLAYTLRKGSPYVPTPLYHEGRLYLISDGGIASALEPSTGREIWSDRLGAEFLGSPVLIEGRIFCATTKGEMIVLATGEAFQLLARNPIGEGTHSTPCVDRGRIYVKTFSHL